MNDTELKRLFQEAKTIAVVGLSNTPGRASLGVGRFLKAQGYHIIPVNPTCDEALGEKCYARIQDIPGEVDIVDIFRKSEAVGEVVADALTKRPKCIWMQEGVVNEEAARVAEAAGIPVVMDRCILKELGRLLPRY